MQRPDVRLALATVALAVFLATVRARKCCPRSQVLNSDLTCIPGSSHLLLYEAEVNVNPPFNCSGNVVLVPATQEEEVDCVDVVVDEISSSLKGVVCESSIEKVFVPEVNFVRKCCPVNRKYSNFREGCWKEDPDDNRTVRSLRTMFLNDTDSAVELIVGVPTCPKGSVLRDFVLHHRHVWRQESESILLKHQGPSDILLVPEEFCVDLTTENNYSLVLRACQDVLLACGKDRPCINKCCSDGTSHHTSPCVSSKVHFDVQFYTLSPHKPPVPSPVLSAGIGFEDQFFKCDNGKYTLDPMKIPTDAFFVTDTGQLFVPKNPVAALRLIDWKDYCLEQINNKTLPFLCFPGERTEKEVLEGAHFQVIAYGLVVSGVFLLITFLVYLCLPSLHNLHGKTLMCHVASLLAAYACLIYIQLFSSIVKPIYCKAASYAIQFSFLAAFSWLNVICFDIWWTFGAIKSHVGKKEESRKKFVMYSVYAWSVPLVITLATFLVDHFRLVPYKFLPKAGHRSCWFSRATHGKTVFFNLPIVIQLITNTILFGLTIRNCHSIKSEIQNMQNNSNAKLKYNADINKLTMNTKLFIVMGLTWGCEVITWYLQWDNDSAWYILDAANIFQGFFIFLIFVIKKKVLRAIKLRLHEVLPSCFLAQLPKHRPSTSTIFTTVASSDSRPVSGQDKK